MAVYIILTVVTVGMAYFIQKPKEIHMGGEVVTRLKMRNRILMCGIFVLLFLVSACRYYVGNDYTRYEEYFRLMMIEGSDGVPTEIGFNLLAKGVQYIFGSGEITNLLIFALIAGVTIFLFLKGIYDLSVEFSFSFFLFMTFGYYFNSMNTIRYYLALALAVISMKYVLRKEYVKFLLVVLLASSFHKSVLFILPVYIMADFVWKKWQMGLLALAAVAGFIMKDFILEIIIRIYPTYADTIYLEAETSYVNILRCLGIFIAGIWLYKETIHERPLNRFFFQLNYLSLLLYLCGSFIPEVSRIGYYMNVSQLFLLPGVIKAIPKGKKRKIWKMLFIGAAVLYFAAFLYTAYDPLIKLLPYRTWIFPE
ncbi:MAG: EpsG family protein [Lachnospiraceae bacterium]|nr:EpsG family protein [Lachnospiraceae bacterium]